ncbi:hypothetical protein [Mycobacterium botniense]|uniref:hypothetical protein n=1 Tax=Mycobacterium botniense TaxID=84962 RepID=UPI0013D38B90|nr:hypothetical protein [Mycobacterium botniense]
MRFNDWLRLPCDLLTEYGCYPIRFAQAVAEGVALGLRRASSPAAADVALAAAGDHQPRQPSSPPRFGNPKVLRAAATQKPFSRKRAPIPRRNGFAWCARFALNAWITR